MTRDLFSAGGPLGIQKTGLNEYSMSITLPKDEHGRVARECPVSPCSPGYFKVKPGTGITDHHEEAFCPYCRKVGEPSDFTSKEQVRYAKDVVRREAEKAIGDVIGAALGPSGKKTLGGGMVSIELSLKKSPPRHVWRPFEEDLLHCVVCPSCGLDHAVFGIATWCPDCGRDIFMEHVKEEYEVVRIMLSDIERRREILGPRIAARDRENCLEDAVSIFEAVLKAMLIRHLRSSGEAEDSIHKILTGKIRNGFQNPSRAQEIVLERMGHKLFDNVLPENLEKLFATFEKRNPITHNLGMIDRKYLEKAYEAEREGREVSVSSEEIERAIGMCWTALEHLHARIFSKPNLGEGEALES